MKYADERSSRFDSYHVLKYEVVAERVMQFIVATGIDQSVRFNS